MTYYSDPAILVGETLATAGGFERFKNDKSKQAFFVPIRITFREVCIDQSIREWWHDVSAMFYKRTQKVLFFDSLENTKMEYRERVEGNKRVKERLCVFVPGWTHVSVLGKIT